MSVGLVLVALRVEEVWLWLFVEGGFATRLEMVMGREVGCQLGGEIGFKNTKEVPSHVSVRTPPAPRP